MSPEMAENKRRTSKSFRKLTKITEDQPEEVYDKIYPKISENQTDIEEVKE